MSRRLARALLALLLGAGLAACSSGESPQTDVAASSATGQTVSVTDGGSYRQVSPAAFEPLLEDEEVTVVNVHVPYAGEITGTDAFVPYDEVKEAEELPEDHDARIALYCRSGSMSSQAAATLVTQGYTNVWELQGGMVAWESSGRELTHAQDSPAGDAG